MGTGNLKMFEGLAEACHERIAEDQASTDTQPKPFENNRLA